MSNGILVLRINGVSLWLVDDHVWKPVNPTKININGVENTFFTSVAINTHRGWVHLDLEPSKEFYKLLARGFKPTSHAKIKPGRKNRRALFHLSLETDLAEITLGYSHRKKGIQRRNGSGSREARKAMKKLREGKKKRDCRMKTANLLVRDAFRIRGVIVFERESREII
jgi:hypothetical protein